jgi:hypothetical protein
MANQQLVKSTGTFTQKLYIKQRYFNQKWGRDRVGTREIFWDGLAIYRDYRYIFIWITYCI